MASLVTLLVAGTVISTTIKVGLVVVGAKAYRARKQETSAQPEQSAPTKRPTLRQRFAQWTFRKPPAAPRPEG